jgi:hypothetical protein
MSSAAVNLEIYHVARRVEAGVIGLEVVELHPFGALSLLFADVERQ